MAAVSTGPVLPDGMCMYFGAPKESSASFSEFPDHSNQGELAVLIDGYLNCTNPSSWADFKAAEQLAPVLARLSKSAPQSNVFHPGAFIGNTVLWADEVDSTQLIPRRIWGAAPPHGTVVAARRQVHGRGRSSNTWESPEGCLMFTTVLRAPLQWGQHMPLLQHAMAVAAAEGVNSALTAAGAASSTQTHIKWPNDLYLSRGGAGLSTAIDDDAPSKIGGILCQSEFDSASSAFVLCVGIGINVFGTEPYRSMQGYLASSPSAQEQEAAQHVAKASLLGHILQSMQGVWEDFECGSPGRGGAPFGKLLARYTKLWLHADQIVTAHDPVAATSSAEATATSMQEGSQVRIFALCCETGALLATEDVQGGAGSGAGLGPVWALHPDGNSLDMMQGLLKHKTQA